jgi:nucleotidyltransferase substrate binding protein (TIGR01987 family)
MSARRSEESFAKLGDALRRFGEILERDLSDDALRDGAIQRFEFTFELFWKALKARFNEGGREVGASPRAVLVAAYAAGWFDDEDVFERMVQDRNLTSHTYDQKLAAEVASRLPGYHAAMRSAYERRDGFR